MRMMLQWEGFSNNLWTLTTGSYSKLDVVSKQRVFRKSSEYQSNTLHYKNK